MDDRSGNRSDRGDITGKDDTPVTWGATGPANARRQQAIVQAEMASAAPGAERSAAAPGRRFSTVAVVAIASVAAIVAGAVSGVIAVTLANPDNGDTRDDSAVQPLTVEQTSAVADAAASTRPSVVRIESTRKVQGGTEQDIGSGVIFDTQGHVVTNAHVVLNTDTLKIILADGSERQAILVGHDFPFTDVAVLQIGPGGLDPVELGDSAAARLGETVIAVGNPLAEFDGSISVGVVSGLDRARMMDGVRQPDLIQTDAAVNSGNSGGALVNLKGQFIGMPTAIIRQSRSGAEVEGIAFALPSNRIAAIAKEIIERGSGIPRPSIQAGHVDLTPELLAQRPRTGVKEGALIEAVAPAGPAAAAGIQPGDVITHVGDYTVDPAHPLLNVLMEFEPGETAKVVLNRNGRIIEAEVRFAQRS